MSSLNINMPELNTLLYIAIIIMSGLFFGRLVKHIKLPNVTGYLIAGLIIGPYVLGIIPGDVTESFDIISSISLQFIAFTIGSSFKLSFLKKVGSTAVVIAILEAMLAVFFVQGTLILFGFNTPESIVLGSIAAATAPAATIMVVKQYKANGPVTQMLMSVVALDDAVALIAFSFSVTIAKAISGSNSGNLFLEILEPFKELGITILIGAIMGYLFTLPLKYFKKISNRTIITCGMVLGAGGLAKLLGGSDLLTCMIMGAVFCNLSKESDIIASITDNITPPIFIMFFVISGAELNINVLKDIGLIGVIYVIMRVLGKVGGAALGAKIKKADKNITRYLGPTLIPQAGVAIGLSLVAKEVVPEFAADIRAVILCATLIYEITGPVITKISLKKAGEIKE